MATAFSALFLSLNELIGDFVPLRRDRVLQRMSRAGQLLIELVDEIDDALIVRLTPFQGTDRRGGPDMTISIVLGAGCAWPHRREPECDEEQAALAALRTVNEYLRAGLAQETDRQVVKQCTG